MNLSSSLPIKTPDAPAPKPPAETAAEQDSTGSTFANLLDEKSAPPDGPAAVNPKSPQPDPEAESAGGLDLPDTAEFSALLAMFPVPPLPAPLPLVPESAAAVPTVEAGYGTTTATAVRMAVPLLAPAISSPATTAEEMAPAPAPGLPVGLERQQAPALPLPFAVARPPAPAFPQPFAVPRPPEPALPLQPGSVAGELQTQAGGVPAARDANGIGSVESAPRQIPPVAISALPPVAAPALESLATVVPKPAPAAQAGTPEVVLTAAHVPLELRGMSIAKQGRTMPDSATLPASEPNKAVPAVDSSAAMQFAPQASLRVSAAPAWQQHTAGDHREERPGFQSQTTFPLQSNEPPAPTPAFAGSPVAPAPQTDEPAALMRSQVETIVHRTTEAAERLRVTGGERVEVQIKLEAGQELTVRLQLTRGEVRPVFLTESHELRQALEQNWSQFSDRGADRNVRVTTPVFESPKSQSGMNDLNQQQREGRQRAFADAQEVALAGMNPAGRTAPRRTPAAAPAVAAPAGVQLYA